jgi:dTDP-4-amino-4,6-dideoxygalactose transaminase
MHSQKAFAERIYDEKDFLNAIALSDTVMSLPMHPYMENSELARIIGSVGDVIVYKKDMWR